MTAALHLALYQPEIPPNTGNLMRLAANIGCRLHLIAPLGFSLDDKLLRRAGLDYRDQAALQLHEHWDAFQHWCGARRLFAFTTHGHHHYHQPTYRHGDVLLFGPETRGLPAALLAALPDTQRVRLPMQPNSRSLNLANAAAIACYEVLRQLDFPGLH